MMELDLADLDRFADEASVPDETGAIWQVSLSPSDLKELVRQARAYQQHVKDTDLWQEIGRIKERLDNLETS